jgi:SAM-dependent methyltransferase
MEYDLMQKFYQTEWFDIQFNSFTKMNSSVQVDEEFYNKFYIEFFKKFSSYDELPENWKREKMLIANFIFEQMQNKSNILSIGCGNGFIENELSKMKWRGDLVAIEPSTSTSSWLKTNSHIKLLNGYFPDILSQKEKYDFAYVSYIDYIFDDKMYIKLLEDIKNYPINNFLLIGASVYNPSIKTIIKATIKNKLAYFGLFNQQLWGYKRTIEEHLDIFNQVNFKKIEYGQLANGAYWIKAINE